MKTKSFIIATMALVPLLFFASCKKYTDKTGPTYYTAGADFTVKDNNFNVQGKGADSKQLDFLDTLPHFFKAEFTSRVDWTIKVTGQTSGAYKIIKGSSSKIDSTNSSWKGGHSGIYFFKKGETCIAEIEFLGSKNVLRDTFSILNVFEFNNKNKNGIILITKTDFESYSTALKNASPDVNVKASSFPSQFSFLEGGDYDLTTVRKRAYPFAIESVDGNNGVSAVQGSAFMRLAYTPNSLRKKQCDNTGYFGGAIQHRYFTKKDSPNNFVVSDWTDPNDLWLNVYVYGDAVTMKSQINVQLHEADAANIPAKTDPSNPSTGLTYDFGGDTLSPIYCKARLTEGYQGTKSAFLKPGFTNDKDKYDANIDDSWDFQFIPDTKGWKLYSIKLADMSPGAGSKGAKIKEPNRIARVQVALIATHPFEYCAIAFEYVTLTKGGPFNPDKY